jgi:hypothetical protein
MRAIPKSQKGRRRASNDTSPSLMKTAKIWTNPLMVNSVKVNQLRKVS